MSVFSYIILASLVLYASWRSVVRRSSKPPLPPGPQKWPLIGNLLDMPRRQEWLKFTEWAKQYGDLVSVTVSGKTFVIINSAKTAMELLDKKSRIYSGRPGFPMAELTGWHQSLALMQFGPRHRRYRRIFHQAIGTNVAVKRFCNLTEIGAHGFLELLIDRPEDFLDHIRRMTGSLVLRITFGYETRNGCDPFLSNVHAAMTHVALITSRGNFLVNYIPALRHVPEWFPGAGFKHVAREWAKTLDEMVERPYEFVEQQMTKGTAEPSVVYELLKDKSKMSQGDIYDIKWVAQSFMSGAADTTVSIIYAFFKAMMLYPEVQAKAQAEIYAVIGSDRLPATEDRKNLPYVSALVSEVFRWHVATPTICHQLLEDDVHNGYFIPKDSIILANAWCMTRDPEVYRNQNDFDPTRFIRTETHEPEPDPRDVAFGFGRRICPGRLLADASIFVTCATVLATFNIMAYTENGKPPVPVTDQWAGSVSQPVPFKCRIIPRSDKVVTLIRVP